ncbi:hypothetical protein BaRGS_00028089 [Batillaria attramentaria]|uniref:Protein SMG9 n=1 Tax=Batillaria attramentaria TaxID=370345 RepID=A0ABD0K1F7_9CAEN
MADAPEGVHRWQRRDRLGRVGSRDNDSSPTPASKPPAPIILGLAKPSASQTPDHESTVSQQQFAGMGDSGASALPEGAGNMAGQHHRSGDGKPIVVLKSRDDNRSSSVSPGPTPAAVQGDTNLSHPAQHPSYAPQAQRHGSTSQQGYDTNKPGSRLAPPPEMKHSVKVIDENFRWLDAGIDDLVDQNDYLVVGAIGLQGTGKSTILSLLGGNTPQDAYRNYIFQPQTKETREEAAHQTVGVDMFATPERIILLDTQPVLSTSVLDIIIRCDKKFPPEYTSTENCIEMQSLQIAAFLMTVCHVIIVAQDWFTDLNFLQSLLTAEMLKPQTPSVSHDGAGGHQEEVSDFHPTVVFMMNKAGQDDFTPETYADMQLTLDRIFHSSKLRYKGAVTMRKDNIISGLKAKESGLAIDVNLFLFPTMEYYKSEPELILTSLPEYRGFPSFSCLLRSFRNQIYAVPRNMMTPTQLSERNWFHFAARMWEAVKKSQLLAEYNRLLP